MLDIPVGNGIQRLISQGYIADIHILVAHKRNRYNIVTVKVTAQDTGSNGIAVKTYKQVKERSTVGYNDILGALFRYMQLLGKVEGVLYSLIVCEPWERLKVFKSYLLLKCQRVLPAYEYVRLRGKELNEFHLFVREDVGYDFLIEPG